MGAKPSLLTLWSHPLCCPVAARAAHSIEFSILVQATCMPQIPKGIQAMSCLASKVLPQLQRLTINAGIPHNAESILKGQAVVLHEP